MLARNLVNHNFLRVFLPPKPRRAPGRPHADRRDDDCSDDLHREIRIDIVIVQYTGSSVRRISCQHMCAKRQRNQRDDDSAERSPRARRFRQVAQAASRSEKNRESRPSRRLWMNCGNDGGRIHLRAGSSFRPARDRGRFARRSFRRGLIDYGLANFVFFARPVAQIDQTAAFAAKRKVRIGFGIGRLPANGAQPLHPAQHTANATTDAQSMVCTASGFLLRPSRFKAQT